MRLFLKITLLYLSISLMVFVAGGAITFQVIKREIDKEQQRFLRERLRWAEKMIAHRHLSKPFHHDKIIIDPIEGEAQETKIVYSDTLVMHVALLRMEPHIKLDVVREVDGRFYKISIYDLIVEEDDIAEGVQESLIKVFIILAIVVLVLGSAASYYIFKPFNSALSKIRGFNLKSHQAIGYEKSNTREFDNLNKFVSEMTQKVVDDYEALKEFSENASHEMQTPLAIANGKLELLLGSENLTDEQVELLSSAQSSVQRLSKLNKALSLLTKIENKEFENKEQVNLQVLISQLIFDFKELMELKSIEISADLAEGVKVYMDPTLAAVLVNNLFQNAIRHNYVNGFIKVNLTNNELVISNSGEPLTMPAEHMFERFRKNNQSKDSIGLGLAIVSKICEINYFSVKYTQEGGRHIVSVKFK
ncbi:HAMP domain-containing histidine kinase [Fulvivirga maritima]|uniref:sensor histidine kinase n=1 Tax=Fulvivirga maritima TaxID=2904247 RepID=UPI001F3045F0|nr:HAMP domain-containing sensor histidine kinase [Fulvivirga maritima]UII26223.1 HAMP domain-containing histidine kinase [Fulvivirga maritima]